MRRILFLIIMCLSFGLMNCSSIFPIRPHYLVLADQQLKQEHKDAILDALNEWATKTNYTMKYDLDFVDMSKVPQNLTQEDTIKIYAMFPGGTRAGWTDWSVNNNSAYIEVDPIYNYDTFKIIMLHELGHAFNLNFDGDSHYRGKAKSVMHPDLGDTADSLQCPELTAFCKEFGCQVDCADVPK